MGTGADGRSRVLIAQRPEGKWRAGSWEFPGGKVEENESTADALSRELREELGVEVRAMAEVAVFSHDYPDRSVEISLWLVREFDGMPRGLDAQALRWVEPERLHDCDLLEADLPMIAPLLRALQ